MSKVRSSKYHILIQSSSTVYRAPSSLHFAARIVSIVHTTQTNAASTRHATWGSVQLKKERPLKIPKR